MHNVEPEVAAYRRVRDLAYATDAAYDATGLRDQRRGNA